MVSLTWLLRYNEHPEYGTVYKFVVERLYVTPIIKLFKKMTQ